MFSFYLGKIYYLMKQDPNINDYSYRNIQYNILWSNMDTMIHESEKKISLCCKFLHKSQCCKQNYMYKNGLAKICLHIHGQWWLLWKHAFSFDRVLLHACVKVICFNIKVSFFLPSGPNSDLTFYTH